MTFEISLDASALRKVSARLNNIEKGVMDATSARQARRIGDFGKQRLAIEVRRFAKNRTGNLERSWTFRSRREGDRRTIEWQSSAPYARIHETGGVIRPRRARALTIPVSSISRKVKGGARRFPGRLRSVPWGLVDQQGTTQYVWAQRVRIKRTGYISKALESTRQFARLEMRRRLRKSFRDRVSIG